jgi:sugar phosphate isomerase/epimerase
MKIGVSSYSYSRLVRGGQIKQIEVPAYAKKVGFDVVEFSTIAVPEGETLDHFAPILREECDKVGIPIANYTIGADFLRAPGGWKSEVERLKGELKIAKILGVPGMRHDATAGFPANHLGGKSFDDALPTLAKGCRAVTEIAADMGIRTMVENHGQFCQDSERVEKLICAVAHPNFGALIDMGNFLCADENPGQAVGRLLPYCFHTHAKDFHVKPGTAPAPGVGWFLSRGGNFLRGAIIGHGDVPVTQCLRRIRQAKFDGVLSIEFEGMEDVLTGIELGLQNLRRFVSETP